MPETIPIDRPAFLIIGAMKSGTTSLADGLVARAFVSFPNGKEPVLLSAPDEEYARRRASYATAMNNADSRDAVGDASPQSMFDPSDSSAQRARELFGPDLPLVCIVRDPVARAVSHFNHAWRGGWRMAETADAAFSEEPVLERFGRYQDQLQKWRDTFGSGRLLVLRFEDFIEDPETWTDRVRDHIGAERREKTGHASHSNKGERQGTLRGPSGLRSAIELARKVPGYKAILESPVGRFGRSLLIKSDTPPAPSKAALARFAELMQESADAFCDEQGWEGERRWDLVRTAEKLGV